MHWCPFSLLKMGCSKQPLGYYALLVIKLGTVRWWGPGKGKKMYKHYQRGIFSTLKKQPLIFLNNQESIAPQGCFGTPHF